MQLSQVAAALKAVSGPAKTHSFLFYGPPKTGKTELVATIADAPEIDRVFWFDLENGADTLLRMHRDGKLSDAAMEKITYIKIPDTREDPTAIETLLKSIASKAAVKICEEHGKVNCQACLTAKKPAIDFEYSKLTKRDALVIDSLSQAGMSAQNLATKGKPVEYKLQLDDYGAMGKWLHDVCTVIQAAQFCHIFAITHVSLMKNPEGTSDVYYPLCGSSNFSCNVAKYFGTVVFVNKKLKKHRAESSTLSSMNTLAGSRLGLELENSDMRLDTALRAVGFLGADGATTPEAIKAESTAAATPEPAAQVEKPKSRFGSK